MEGKNMEGTADHAGRRSLTIAYVEGVTPAKWFGRWESRMPGVPLTSFRTDAAEQLTAMRTGRADMSFVRLPADTDGLHAIPLYVETAVVAMPREHELSILDDVPTVELDGRTVLTDDGNGFKALIELVATGVGVAVVPMSIARLYARKDVVVRPMPDAPGTQIALTWPRPAANDEMPDGVSARDSDGGETLGPDPDIIEEFIGIVRGRTANSSRQPSTKREQKRGESSGEASGGKRGNQSGKPAKKRHGPAGRRPRGTRRPPRRR